MKILYKKHNVATFQATFTKEILCLFCLLVLCCLTAQAQVGIGTITPDPSAQLDVSSTSKGVLVPRMSLSDRGLIGSPAEGLLIYQTDNKPGFYYYNGSAWTPFISEPSPAIIPFASGLPVVMTTLVGGLAGTSSVVGFGSSATGISVLNGGIIDLTGAGGTALNYAFSAPRSGIITSLSAYFSTTLSLVLIGSTVTVTAQLYRSSGPDNLFTALPGAMVTLAPALGGVVTSGAVSNGISTGLNMPVNAQDRLLLVFSSNASGSPIVTTVVGYASAGLSIK